MIAISSHRAHPRNNVGTYARNQIRAHKSWEKYFDTITYFGPYEKGLSGPTTYFIDSENWPFIKDIAAEAGRATAKYVAVINADIVVTQPIKFIEGIMTASQITAVSSRRRDYGTRKLLDNDKGRDIFICTPTVWRMVSKNVPDSCRIGHQQWDSWMIAFLRTVLANGFGEFTRIPCIYHPQHEGRKMPHAEEVDISQSRYQISMHRYDPQLVLQQPLQGLEMIKE